MNSSESILHKNIMTGKEDFMKKYLLLTVAVILSLLVAMPVVAQYGPGWRDDYGWHQGRGMGGGGLIFISHGLMSPGQIDNT